MGVTRAMQDRGNLLGQASAADPRYARRTLTARPERSRSASVSARLQRAGSEHGGRSRSDTEGDRELRSLDSWNRPTRATQRAAISTSPTRSIGEGPLDLVYTGSWTNQIEHAWELASYRRFLERLASFSRLITFDKRGSGLSDRIAGTPTLEDRMDDLRAVLDAVGSERAALFGSSEGGVLSAMFAASYPERARALVLFSSLARIQRTEDYPWGWTPAFFEAVLDYVEHRWGSGEVPVVCPDAVEDEQFRRWHGRLERLVGTPGSARAMLQWNWAIDIRPLLPTITVPTLVLHRAEEAWLEPGLGRYLADHIPIARFVEIRGRDHYPYLEPVEPTLHEIERFLTGARHEPVGERVLATILFTDVVRSTERAAELGDRRWRELLDRHDAVTAVELNRFGGHAIKSLGDGLLATFDGPARAIRCARAIMGALAGLGLEVRAGIHTGECERRGDDLGGIAMHIGARIADCADPGEVLVSRTVKDLVFGSGIEFEDRGARSLKGVPGEWRVFAAAPAA
jgi:class 3 adenylate cyclase